MNKQKKAALTFLRIGIISIIFIFCLSIMVFGDNFQLSNVKVQFANKSEINIFTSKMKISEILEEANIKLLPDETVLPNLEEQITKDKKIIISKTTEVQPLAVTATAEEIDINNLKDAYSTIVEKIIVIQEEIPFETIEKDTTGSGTKTSNKVIQNGVNGLKETKYKVKYKNEIEISREEVSSQIIKKPINKIVQVSYNQTTSRNAEIRTSGSTLGNKVAGMTPKVVNLNASAYTASTCGKAPGSKGYGITASGAKATGWYTVAAGKGYKLGTVIYVPYFKDKPNGGWFVVQDRGGAISNNKLDVYMDTYNECIQFGRRNIECYIYE